MNNFFSTTSKPQISSDNFIGRKTEIDLLVQSLSTQNSIHQTTGNIAVISGETGIGKTELALIIAKHLDNEFPDGQLIISFDKDPENKLIVSEILETIIHNIAPFALLSDDLNELKALYTSLLESRKILIFDEHKFYIKQSLKWLLIQDITSPVINALFLEYYKIIDAFGRLRFFPKNELIPPTKRLFH